MPLTEESLQVISCHPIGDALVSTRSKLSCINEVNGPTRQNINDVLYSLAGTTAAIKLPSPGGRDSLSDDLLSILQFRETGVNDHQYHDLVVHIANKSSDNTIWSEVFRLVGAFACNQNLRSIPPTLYGTPIETSSSRLSDSEVREAVEGEIFHEIKICTFRNVGGFWDKHFNSQIWSEEQNEMLKGILTAHGENRWKDFPPIPNEKPV